MVPARIAALIESRTNISGLRVQVRGVDPEASAVLEAIREAALIWPGFHLETGDDVDRQPAPRSKWLRTGQVAEHLGISRQAVGKAIRSGRLPATKTGIGYQVSREDMEHYRAARAA
jgi:excisionase family DNA binding protein